ncbi:hypothetical protein F2Q70_00017552 [Brassica cretica]|uniref:Uncharacterized protein n=1 Tax=Brassica cretica TaxID=69181 RepID=A0A8S9I314_BRACR|nr:hypothetical protein F2Q70_00017552 [Brassica cretica]
MVTFESFFLRLGLIVRRIFRVKVAWSYSWSVTEVDLANDREESVPFNVHDATSILEFSSSQMFSMLFRDSLGSTETERNTLGRSRDAKDDQEDSPGDEVLATGQGARGRMVRPWRHAKEKSRARFIALPVAKSRGKVFDFLQNCGTCVSVGHRRSGGWSCLTSVVANWNVRAPGSIVSKTQSEAHSSPSSTRISGPSCTRPRSDIGETDHPPGSEYGSDLSGPWDRGITGAMSCLREACIEFLPTPGRTTASGSPLEGTPVPRIPARRNPGSPLWSFPCPVPGSPPSSGKWKTSDKENLPWGDPGTGPGKLHSGEPGFLIAGILGTGVPSSEDPKTGVLPGTRGITCPLKSTGVAYSQQASLRQDIAPVIPQSRVPLRSVPYSEPGGRSVFPTSDRGLVLFGPLILVEDGELWASDGILETMEPGDLTFPEEELA